MKKNLTLTPEGWDEALGLLDTVDAALGAGLSRLPEEQRSRLAQLSEAFSGTPLAPAVTEGMERLLRSEFSPAAFVSLAAARSAVTGAIHDALIQQALEAADQTPAELLETPPAPAGESAALLAGTQQWLAELAVAGFANLEEAQLSPFDTILEQLQAQEGHCGLAALLTGFVEELTHAAQRRSRQDPPIRRWADLWCAAMLGAQAQTAPPGFRNVTGLFHPCGMDVRQHRAFVSAALWGLLVEEGMAPRVVKIPCSSWKVSVVTGDDLWKLFQPGIQPLLEALASGNALRVMGEFSATGDLRLTEPPEAAGPATPFELPSPWIAIPPLPAASRHPVHALCLMRLEDCQVEAASVVCGEVSLPIAEDHMDATDLDPKMLAAATDMIGLLRWDAGSWRVQPLIIRGKGKLKTGIRAGQGIAARSAKSKSDTLATLKERASRLLRAH